VLKFDSSKPTKTAGSKRNLNQSITLYAILDDGLADAYAL
jgi:hypothetical protein